MITKIKCIFGKHDYEISGYDYIKLTGKRLKPVQYRDIVEVSKCKHCNNERWEYYAEIEFKHYREYIKRLNDNLWKSKTTLYKIMNEID